MAAGTHEPKSKSESKSESEPEPKSDEHKSESSSSSRDENEIDRISITLTHRSTAHTFELPGAATLSDLTAQVAAALSVPATLQKLLAPGLGVLRDPALPLAEIPPGKRQRLMLIGSSPAEVAAVVEAAKSAPHHLRHRNRGPGPVPAARLSPRAVADPKRAREDALYTFLELRPLPYLPNPERSLTYLTRVRDDPGVRAVMRKYKWTVPLLLEMNPAEHTTHDSKVLGLNRNRGEVIELRIRTDDYGGYRDYKTVRRTVVHELCHNVFGDHDRQFWDLYKKLEEEVRRADWTAGGHSLGDDEFYNPPGGSRYLGGGGGDDAAEGEVDGGGWVGGEYVLGRGAVGGDLSLSLSRREVMARAAEERLGKVARPGEGDKRKEEAEEASPSSSSSSPPWPPAS